MAAQRLLLAQVFFLIFLFQHFPLYFAFCILLLIAKNILKDLQNGENWEMASQLGKKIVIVGSFQVTSTHVFANNHSRFLNVQYHKFFY